MLSLFFPGLDLCLLLKIGTLYFLFGFSDTSLYFLYIRLQLGFTGLLSMLYFAIDFLCINADSFFAYFLCVLYLVSYLLRTGIKFLCISMELLFADFLCVLDFRTHFLYQRIDTLTDCFMTCHFLVCLCLCAKRTESCKYCQQ